jgi:hypothetical protein
MKAKVKCIDEGTRAIFTDLEDVLKYDIIFDEDCLQFIAGVYEFTQDEFSNELWYFYPNNDEIEHYLHEDWLEFLEPVQERMI